MSGRRGKVVSNRGGLIWPNGVRCTVQVRSVHKSDKPSTVDFRNHRHELKTTEPRQHTPDNRETTGHMGPVD